MPKLLAGLLVFIFGSQLGNATTLVAFRDSKSVVLAADSKVLPFKSSDQPTTQSKISRCGRYFVAVAGIQHMTAANVRFNLDEIIANSCKLQQTPVEAIDALARPRINHPTSRLRRNLQDSWLTRHAAQRDSQG